MEMRLNFPATAGAMLFITLSQLAAGQLSAHAQELTDVTVVIPNPSAINNFALYTALGEGYFEDEGLNVAVETVNGSASVLQTMAAGQAQIGNPGAGPVLNARARGEDVVFIYNNFAKSVFGLVVKEEAPIATPADLKGAVIGVGTADGAEVGFTRAIMAEAGYEEGTDYEFLTIGDGGTAAAALLNDEVVAYAAAVSDVAVIEARGIELREITPEAFFAYFGNGWASTQAFIDQNPEVIEGFGKAYVRANKFALEPANRETVLAHAAAGNPQEGEDKAFADSLLTAIMSRTTLDDPAALWGYQPPEHWELWHQSLLETGELTEPLPDLSAVYTNDFIEVWNADE